jgi:nucleotide-binding universal stress UspA family protein
MKLLVAVDGSDLALDAVRHALRLRDAGLKADLVLATVQEPTFLYEMVLPPSAEVLERVSGAVGNRALEGAEALLRAAGVPFEREIGSGDPAQTLIELAGRHGCEGIIVGARGLGAVRSALLGSVSQAVLHAAMVPVTIVKHAPPDVGTGR